MKVLAAVVLGGLLCHASTFYPTAFSGSDLAAYQAGTTLSSVQTGSEFVVDGDILTSSYLEQLDPLTLVPPSVVETGGVPVGTGAASFAALTALLDGTAGGATPLALLSGQVNDIAPGTYSLGGPITLGAGTVLNLTGNGDYYFHIAGNFTLADVLVFPVDTGLNSDDVFWYISSPVNQVSVTNSTFFGNIVSVLGGPHEIVASDGDDHRMVGRMLSSSGAALSLIATGNSSQTLISGGTQADLVPEPATSALAALGLAALLFARHRRAAVVQKK